MYVYHEFKMYLGTNHFEKKKLYKKKRLVSVINIGNGTFPTSYKYIKLYIPLFKVILIDFKFLHT